MYGDKMTDSMKKAIDETNRRREIQIKYNKEHGIVPKTVYKEIQDPVHGKETKEETLAYLKKKGKGKKNQEKLIASLEKEMKEAARQLDFERAMQLRDMLYELKAE